MVTRVLHLRAQGLSLRAISEVLNTNSVPTPAGRSRWTKSHVDRLLHTRHVRQMVAPLPQRCEASTADCQRG
ncbi:recombinase family protein [Microbispora bryophytorum]|uniref:recombinase family protein n=1 Tax=Microbispora bryophytorum TaxID=1460882 RepID=UPI0033C45A14